MIYLSYCLLTNLLIYNSHSG